MTSADPDTEELLRRAAGGDRTARNDLLQRHRGRLQRMLAFRMDSRLKARLDPSDVVQETLVEAARRLEDYLSRRPLPFYPWLRQLGWERLVEEHRRHLRAGRRSVLREEAEPLRLPGSSALELVDRLLDSGQGPSAALQRKELRQRVRAALDALEASDREVLVLRYLKQLSAREVGAVLGISEAAAKKRALRALQRLHASLKEEAPEERP